MILSKKATKSRLLSIQNKSTGGLAAAIMIALAALIVPMGLTKASAQESLTATITIDSVQLNRDRTLTVEYTVTCSEPATITFSLVRVTQSSGKFGNKVVSGSIFANPALPCGETVTQTVVAETGFFTPGRAVVRVSADACNNDFECINVNTEKVANLKR